MLKPRDKVTVLPEAVDDGSKHVLRMARKLSATVGVEFFSTIAKHLASELAADCVYIGEFASGTVERIRALAAFIDGKPEQLEYSLAETAAADIVLGKSCFCRTGAQKRFPHDELLKKAGAKAFAGVPLADAGGHPLGFMMAIYRRSTANLDLARSILEILAHRAAAELVRKQREERLQESEQRYKAFIARNSDAMWRIEFEQPIPTALPEMEQVERIYQYGHLAECNDALANWLGVSRAEQLIGCNLDLVAPRSNPSIQKAMLKAIRSGYRFTTVETTPVDRSGKRHYMLRTQCGIVEDGMLRRMWGITRDMTGLKQSQVELDASEQRMAELLESVHLAVVMLDPQGTIAFCNDYLLRLTGWRSADLVGEDWLNLMIPPEESARLRAAFDRVQEGSPVALHFESTLLGAHGGRWWIGWDRALLRDAGGKVAAIVNIGRDLTDQKVLETQFRQAQKLESVGRLASGVAHDFNNLLTIIRGYSDVLLLDKEPSDPAYIALTEIRKSAERGAQLTHQLLAFSRRQNLQPEVLNLNALIADNERMLRRLIGEDIQLHSSHDPDLGLVMADAGQIHQVVLNLAVNARDAMPRGGELSIRTSNLDVVGAPSGTSFGLAPGSYVQLAIADTGVGMSEEARNHLFEPFFTTKDPGKGTGLGLSAAYGIVRQSGGDIVVETELNKGTCIRIFLPRLDQKAAPELAASASAAVRGGEEIILLVEDDERVRIVAAEMARDLGYKVLEAASPRQALEIARQSGEIDLLLTDIVMPETSGTELAESVKGIHPGIKLVYMSGYADLPDMDQHLSESGVSYLQKPFNTSSLAAALRNSLDRD